MERIKILLGKKIKEVRTKRGLSQQQLAEMIDIDQRNLSKIECGKCFPGKSLEKISEALDLTLPELFDFEHLEITDNIKREFIKTTVDKLPSGLLNPIYKLLKSWLN